MPTEASTEAFKMVLEYFQELSLNLTNIEETVEVNGTNDTEEI